MSHINPCPFCGGKAVVSPFICKIIEQPKPIKLFGRWSLIKMRYREIPTLYTVDCERFCNEYLDSQIYSVGKTTEEAINEWNKLKQCINR